MQLEDLAMVLSTADTGGMAMWNVAMVRWRTVQESLERYTYKCRQSGRHSILGTNQAQYKLNSDDDDDESIMLSAMARCM